MRAGAEPPTPLTLTMGLKRDVKRPSRFTGNVWLETRYTTADSVVYIGGLSVVVE